MSTYLSESSIDQEYANLDGMKYVLDQVVGKFLKNHYHPSKNSDADFRITVGEDYYMTVEEQKEYDCYTFKKAIAEVDVDPQDMILLEISKNLLERSWQEVINQDPENPKKLMAFNLTIGLIEAEELEGGKGYMVTGEVVV